METKFSPRVTCFCGQDVAVQSVDGLRFSGTCAKCGRSLSYLVRTEERLKELAAAKPKRKK